MILDVSSVPYNLNKQTVVVRVLGFLWRLLRLLCHLLLLLLQFFKLVLLLLPGLPSVDTLVYFLVVENHTNARSHLPHIVSTFISIPPATAAKAHLHYSFSLLFQNSVITSLMMKKKKKKKSLIQSIPHLQSCKSPK
jgi:hypothetical protein